MSGAHDKSPVYPDEQESIKNFEITYDQYRKRISKYLSLKVNPMVADDLTQQVFLKAIAKNEFRSLSRRKETSFDFIGFESQSISLDFAKYVESRIDISLALKKLNQLDQQIISLRFFVDCTLSEISKIVGMRV